MLLEPTTWAWLFFAGGWLIRLAALVTVPSRRSPAEARSWLLIIFIEPWAGLVLFLLLGNRRLPRRRRRRLAELPSVFAAVRERLRGLPNIVHPELGPELAPAVRLAENLGHMPILGGSAIEVLVDYEGVIDRLVDDIDAAGHHVHLLFYIFADDRTAQRVIDALARAAAAASGAACWSTRSARARHLRRCPRAGGGRRRGARGAAGRPAPLAAGPHRPAQPPQDRRHRRPDRLHRLAEHRRCGLSRKTSRMRN